MNFRSIFNLLGILLAIFSISFLPPLAMTAIYQETGGAIFLYSFLFLFLAGVLMWVSSRQETLPLNISDGFIITTMFWIVLAVAGSIPFYFSGLDLTAALFESVSGITTTGATIMVGLDDMPKSLLLYRQLLQWI